MLEVSPPVYWCSRLAEERREEKVVVAERLFDRTVAAAAATANVVHLPRRLCWLTGWLAGKRELIAAVEEERRKRHWTAGATRGEQHDQRVLLLLYGSHATHTHTHT